MDRRGNSRKILTLLTVAIALLILGVVGTGFIISKSNRSFPNMTIDDIEVGRMTKEEILSKLSNNGWDIKTSSPVKVYSFCDTYQEFEPLKAGILSDSDTVSTAAVEFGKSGNIFQNLLTYVECLKEKKDINSLYSKTDETYLDNTIQLLQNKIDEKISDNAFSLNKDEKTLTVYKGYGNKIKLDDTLLKEDIIQALKNGKTEIDYYTCTEQNVKTDIEKLFELATTEPIDAHFSTDGSHEIIEAQDGYSFDVTEAKKIDDSTSSGQKVSIPLKVTKAEIMAKDLEPMLYRDLLGAMTTKYNNSNDNRSSNVRLATSLVNDVVIFPGEEFSFNKTVGKRTEEAGFLMAPAYAGYGDMKEELGGGVCQVSTGIYASALFAFLDITAHTCHIYPPNYIQLGTDATVSIPDSGREIDFKFKNNKSFPIKIVGYCEEKEDEKTGKSSKKVTIEIWGTLEDTDYMPVEFDNAWGDVYDYDRVIEPAYPDRPGYRLQFTHDETEFEDDTGKGLRTLTYRRVYDSEGNVVEKKILNKKYDFGYGMDTYYYKE